MAKRNKFEKFSAPGRDVMSAGVKTPRCSYLNAQEILERTHALLCAFIGQLSSRIHQIMEGEDCQIKDALRLILQMDAAYGYYPLHKLIVGGKPSASYFRRIGDDPENPRINDLVKSPDDPKRKVSGVRQALKNLRSKCVQQTGKKQATIDTSLTPEVLLLLRQVTSYDAFNDSSVSPPLSEFKHWFEKKNKGGFGLSAALGELIITEALQYVSHYLELKALYDGEREIQEAKLEAFKESNNGKALLKACEGLESGAATYIKPYQFPEFANWREKCPRPSYPSVDLDHPTWPAEFRKLNPEINAFFAAKKAYCELLKSKDPPTWRPVLWNQGRSRDAKKGRRYPFFNLKYFCCGNGLIPIQGMHVLNATLKLRLLDVSDEAYQAALRGELHSGFTEHKKGQGVEVELTPEKRLRDALASTALGESLTKFRITDPKSKSIILREFTGLRFSENQGIWEAKLTFKPEVGNTFDFEDVLKVYRKGKPAPFIPGTLISSFVVTATASYIPRNDKAGWFATYGVNEDGSLTELYCTAVTPYLQKPKGGCLRKDFRGDLRAENREALAKAWTRLQSARVGDVVQIKFRYRVKKQKKATTQNPSNEKGRGVRFVYVYYMKRSDKPSRTAFEAEVENQLGVSVGHAKHVPIEKLVFLKKQIVRNLHLSHRDPKKPNKGDNRKLWDKLNDCSETFREQLSAQVIRLALRVEGRLKPQGSLTERDVAQPRRIQEWLRLHPNAKHLLVVPAPMGSSHQSFRSRGENKLVHTLGIAEIYRLILTKSCYSQVSSTFVTKVGMWITNIFTGEKITSTDTGEVRIVNQAGKEVLVPRGRIGATNLVKRLFSPLPKKVQELEEQSV